MEQQGIREAAPEAIYISNVCIRGNIITLFFILKQVRIRCMAKRREVEVVEEM